MQTLLTYEGLAVGGVKRKARDAPERMCVLDAFKGHLTPEIKAAITGSSMNTLWSYLGI
jgi:hypothetical protein